MRLHKNRGSILTLAGITLLALCAIFLTRCKKYEVAQQVIVKTEGVSEITRNSCRAAGTLVDVGSTGVTQHGFCWSLTPNPAEAIDCNPQGPRRERGSFFTIIEGLDPGREYHLWAYAENEDGRRYGEPLVFATHESGVPIVRTFPPEAVSATTAFVIGEILHDGGAAIEERGFCWSPEPEPTVEGMHHPIGPGPGPFEMNIEGLAPNNTYFVRAFAANEFGIGYGEQHEFRTLTP
ncbi:MAG: hypothetical protein ABFS10_02685 [Bacteroidota bacterium]